MPFLQHFFFSSIPALSLFCDQEKKLLVAQTSSFLRPSVPTRFHFFFFGCQGRTERPLFTRKRKNGTATQQVLLTLLFTPAGPKTRMPREERNFFPPPFSLTRSELIPFFLHPRDVLLIFFFSLLLLFFLPALITLFLTF